MPQSQILPDDLGALRVKYSAPREDFYKSLLVFVLVLGGAMAFVLMLSVLVALTDNAEAVLVIALVLVLLAAFPLWRLVRWALRLLAIRQVWVYDGGFAVHEGDAVQALGWGEIEAIYIKAERLGIDYLPDTEAVRDSARLNFILKIRATDGREILIESAVRQMRDVIRSIGRRHAVYTLPRVLDKIEAGELYYFGRLKLEADRLSFGDIGFRWYPMQRVSFEYAGDMVIEQQGAPRPRAVLPTASIPNLHLLMLILSQHAEVIDLDNGTVVLEKWQTSVVQLES